MNPSHAVKIAQFLRLPEGIALMEELKDRRPSLTGATFEQTALSSKEASGWEKCIAEIKAISEERPTEPLQSSGFIDPSEDDSPPDGGATKETKE